MGLLDGKVAIVTGAGGGIGREHAKMLAGEGAAVVVNDVGGSRDGTGGSTSMADETVEEIRKAGGRAAANYDNVATMEGGQNIFQTAIDQFGQVDVLVNNAGILRDKTFAKMDENMWDSVIAVHLKGTFCVTHPVFQHMRERGEGGVIINTSSTSGLLGNFGQTNYGAAKAGIAGLTRCLAIEGRRYGIRCFAVAPVAYTRMTEDLDRFQQDDAQERLDPAQISPLVVYLASSLSEEHTGKIFYAGGGKLAEMKVVTAEPATKTEGRWTPQEIAERINAGDILLG